MLDYETLRLIWWLLIGIILVAFMVTDGFDMGVGCLLPLIARNDDERRVLINSVGAHWEGNQVWLILAGGALFAAWPRVYAAAFSGFYVAMILVLCALFFRPLAFDYRGKIANARWRWSGLSRGRDNSTRALRFLAPRFIRGAFLSPFHQLAKTPNLPSLIIEITLIEPHIVGRSK